MGAFTDYYKQLPSANIYIIPLIMQRPANCKPNISYRHQSEVISKRLVGHQVQCHTNWLYKRLACVNALMKKTYYNINTIAKKHL